LFFTREIEDIKDHIKTNTRLAKRFIDLNDDETVDTDAQNLLSVLSEKIRSTMPATNFFNFKVKWDPNKGVTRATHPDYMKNFGNTFYNAVKQLIDQNASQPYYLDRFSMKDKHIVQEIVEHANFSNECVEKFHGRIDLLDRVSIFEFPDQFESETKKSLINKKMKQYILEDSNTPFFVYGESGCGKTSVIAKLANEVNC
jgi:hypothetical protein